MSDDVFKRAFAAILIQDTHAVGLTSALEPDVCTACTRWAFAVARGRILRTDVTMRCADGQRWQTDINAALAILEQERT